MKGAPSTVSVTRAARQRLKRIRSPAAAEPAVERIADHVDLDLRGQEVDREQIGTGNSPEDRSAPLPETPRTLSRA